MSEKHKPHNCQKSDSISFFNSNSSMLENDPLDEIFELNMGSFLTEHLINEDFAKKIAKSTFDKNQGLKNQLSELISIYSIDKTLSVLGFNAKEEYIIYNSIAQTLKTMMSLEYCTIYLKDSDKNLKLSGTSIKENDILISDEVKKSFELEEKIHYQISDYDVTIFPMKNRYECIGAIEVARNTSKKLEHEYVKMIEITAQLFVTSLGMQKLIDEVGRILALETVSTGELQNLRAQLTVIIGDLGAQQQAFVEAMAQAVDVKSKNKTKHSERSANLAKKICEHLNLNEKTTDLIYYAGLLQNIGQIQLSDDIFNKDKLTKEERDKLQDHPNAGVTLLMNIYFMSEVIPYIHYQKERWDGKGTPEGLLGASIPFGSRIISVADAFCALLEDRPYRKAKSKNEAIEIMKKESGEKWDPTVIEALCEVITE